MLEIENLRVRLGSTVIEIPEMKVSEGDYVAIMGTTGAGKTVLIETIAGFYPQEQGSIKINGKDVSKLPPSKRGVAIVYQDYMLFPHMTVRENLAYPLKIRKNHDEKRIIRMAQMLEIEHLLDRMPGTLSGGEQQRVALARALIIEPKLLLMDEPFSSLDRKTRERIRKIVKNAIERTGTTVIHITHNLETARIMANKIAIMHDGTLMQYGDTDEILSRPNTEFVAEFVDTNILRGTVMGTEGKLTTVAVGNERIFISERAQGEVYLSIRPEEIIISREKLRSSMRNCLNGKIAKMTPAGNVVRITLSFHGFSLFCILTPNAVSALSLEEGDEVFAYFKASSVKLIA
ncbi:MAG: ATP-binding cassette domain-containing protein [Euryarchaeota archaeon]|nr:ATP-binding cassette domain-containing protein [Euryarchaeota archaeon]